MARGKDSKDTLIGELINIHLKCRRRVERSIGIGKRIGNRITDKRGM